jgi:hypothetical protein
MRKFSEGGALGKYNRRMADIKKDFAKDSAGKSGRALEVLEAKRAQRIADAEDDRAKRTGGDRTATRAAERLAESNLTKTRKYGAPKAVTTEVPVAKITETLSVPKMDSSIGKKPAATKTPVKTTRAPVSTPVVKPVEDKAKPPVGSMAGSNLPSDQGFSSKQRGRVVPKGPKAEANKDTGTVPRGPSTKTGLNPNSIAARIMRGDLFKTSDTFRKSQEAKYGKAKGGKIMKKYAAGGVTKQMPSSKAMGSMDMAKGGKAKAKAKAKGNPFAATKFGAALMKKSADTKGRAMVKKAGGGKCYAKGGSIDGIAVKGKTKAKRVTMKNGGSC